jgi:hypothetical protein
MKKLLLFLALCAIASAPLRADIFLNTGDNLQNALNSVNCGEHIILQAGSSYAGNFTLPLKPGCTQYIEIKTNGLIPVAGNRITPADASHMAKIISNSSFPAIGAQSSAGYYKFIGIEVTNVGGSMVTQELVVLDHTNHHVTFDRTWVHEATNDTTTPSGTITTAIRGFNINASDVMITESRIAGFRAYQPVSQGVEASMAILFPNRALRATVQNTYLEAWFVPVFFGGSGGDSPNKATLSGASFDANSHTGAAVFSSAPNLAIGDLIAMKTTGGRTPPTNYAHPYEPVDFQVAKVAGISGNIVNFQSWGAFDGDLSGGNPLLQTPDQPGLVQWNGYLNEDIKLLRNDFVLNFASTEAVWTATGGSPTTLPRSTQVNTGNAPKGFIEIKMGRNILIEGNTFDGWMNGLVLSSRNQGSVGYFNAFPWFGLFDVKIQNNWWKRMANWDRLYSIILGGPQLQDNEMTSMRSGPLLFRNNLIESGAEAILSQMISADNVTVTHNTYPGMDTGMSSPASRIVNAHSANSPNFILKDNIFPSNEYALVCFIESGCWPPGITQSHNVMIDNRTPGQAAGDGPLSSRYPSDFIVMNQASVGWAADFSLAASSPYKNMASDGKDPGVDMVELLAALGGTTDPPPDDETAPITSITSPSNGATVSGIVPVTASASDNVGVTHVEFQLNGGFLDDDTTAPYETQLDTSLLASGQYSLSSRAFDAAGNVGISSAITINIPSGDTQSPAVSLSASQDNKNNVTATAVASDNVGVVRVEFYLDGNLKSADTSAPYTSSFKLTGPPGSTHILTAKAFDAAGNVGTSFPITLVKN